MYIYINLPFVLEVKVYKIFRNKSRRVCASEFQAVMRAFSEAIFFNNLWHTVNLKMHQNPNVWELKIIQIFWKYFFYKFPFRIKENCSHVKIQLSQSLVIIKSAKTKLFCILLYISYHVIKKWRIKYVCKWFCRNNIFWKFPRLWISFPK